MAETNFHSDTTDSIDGKDLLDEGTLAPEVAGDAVVEIDDGTGPVSVKVTFESESAAFRNTFGYFREDTGQAEIIFADVDETSLAPGTMEAFDLTAEQYGALTFFLVPDGATKNAALFSDLNAIDLVVEEVNGVLQARDLTTDTVLEGFVNPLYVPEKDGNPDATLHARRIGDADDFELRWEDLPGGGDKDYNDAIIQVEIIPEKELPVLSIATVDADKDEGTDTSTPFTFTITRTGDLSGESTVRWTAVGSLSQVPDGSYADADDFIGEGFPSDTVTFAANHDVETITVPVDADNVPEDDEAFKVGLSAATGATVDMDNASADSVIRNDDFAPDPLVSIAATNADQNEGDEGTTEFSFTVTRSSEDLSGTSSVEVAFGAGDTDAADFVGGLPATQTVTFAADETEKTVIIPVSGDLDVEPDETFSLTLQNTTDAAIDTDNASADGVIRNDDIPIEPAFIGDDVFEDVNGNGARDEGEAGIAGVTVDLVADADGNGVIDDGDSVVGTATTDDEGKYGFADLAAGAYIVDVDAPAGFGLTTPPEPRPVSVAGVRPSSPPISAINESRSRWPPSATLSGMISTTTASKMPTSRVSRA